MSIDLWMLLPNRVSHRTKILTSTGVLDDKWTPVTHITMTGWWHGIWEAVNKWKPTKLEPIDRGEGGGWWCPLGLPKNTRLVSGYTIGR